MPPKTCMTFFLLWNTNEDILKSVSIECTMEMKGVGFVLNPIKYHCMNKNWCERSITVFPLQSGRW